MFVLGGCVFSPSWGCQLGMIINSAIMTLVGELIFGKKKDIDMWHLSCQMWTTALLQPFPGSRNINVLVYFIAFALSACLYIPFAYLPVYREHSCVYQTQLSKLTK